MSDEPGYKFSGASSGDFETQRIKLREPELANVDGLVRLVFSVVSDVLETPKPTGSLFKLNEWMKLLLEKEKEIRAYCEQLAAQPAQTDPAQEMEMLTFDEVREIFLSFAEPPSPFSPARVWLPPLAEAIQRACAAKWGLKIKEPSNENT